VREVTEEERRDLVVVKLGSSLLRGPDGFVRAVEEIAHQLRNGRRVVAVVSARRGVTDALEREARAVASEPPDPLLLALLLRTGEEASAALMGLALQRAAVRVRVLIADELGLRTCGALDDAEPTDVDVSGLRVSLEAHDVVVVPGFVGRDAAGRPALLGRGGSDYTALYLASRLGAAEARLVKDVEGVFAVDPRITRAGVRAAGGAAWSRSEPPLPHATWAEVERIGNGVVQPKALRFAERVGLSFRVAAAGGRGTLVGPRRHPERRDGPGTAIKTAP
jgi:homoserine dehydrogenase